MSAQSPMWGSNSWTMRSWPEPKSALNWLSHPGAPTLTFLKFFIKKIFLMFTFYFWERERHGAWVGEGQREKETQNSKQAPCCQHKPWNHDLSWSRMLNQLSHPGTPTLTFLHYTFLWDFIFLRDLTNIIMLLMLTYVYSEALFVQCSSVFILFF